MLRVQTNMAGYHVPIERTNFIKHAEILVMFYSLLIKVTSFHCSVQKLCLCHEYICHKGNATAYELQSKYLPRTIKIFKEEVSRHKIVGEH